MTAIKCIVLHLGMELGTGGTGMNNPLGLESKKS